MWFACRRWSTRRTPARGAASAMSASPLSAVLEHAQVAARWLGEEDVEAARASRSPARTPSTAARARRSSATRERMSRNGRDSLRPSRTIRIRPGCSTTKTRLRSPGRRRHVHRAGRSARSRSSRTAAACAAGRRGDAAPPPAQRRRERRRGRPATRRRGGPSRDRMANRRCEPCPVRVRSQLAMRALVTGATGAVGGRLAHALAERGHEVRCMVRDRARASDLADAGFELHEGDVLKPDSLSGAGEGVDIAYYLIHSMGRGRRRRLRRARAQGRAGVRRDGARRGRRPRRLPRRARRGPEVPAPEEPPGDGRDPARRGPAAHLLPRVDAGRRRRASRTRRCATWSSGCPR